MTITLDNRDEVLLLFGSRDQNLRAIRDALGVRLVARGDTVQVDGPEDKVGQAERVFQQLRDVLRRQGSLSTEEVRTILEVVQHGGDRQGQQNLAAMEGFIPGGKKGSAIKRRVEYRLRGGESGSIRTDVGNAQGSGIPCE